MLGFFGLQLNEWDFFHLKVFHYFNDSVQRECITDKSSVHDMNSKLALANYDHALCSKLFVESL